MFGISSSMNPVKDQGHRSGSGMGANYSSCQYPVSFVCFVYRTGINSVCTALLVVVGVHRSGLCVLCHDHDPWRP